MTNANGKLTWLRRPGTNRWCADAGNGRAYEVEKIGTHWFRPWFHGADRSTKGEPTLSLNAAKTAALSLSL